MLEKPKNELFSPVLCNNVVYQMKITLKGVKPPLWRRIQVNSNITLKAFHRTIQVAMGWGNGHLHEFNIHGLSYSNDGDGVGSDEKRVRLNRLNLKEKDKFVYVYDSGDTWEHAIRVEKILHVDEKFQYPICIKGERSCPPEDCGGTEGYSELLEVLSDPYHSDHEESIERVGVDFEPEMFDVEKTNWRLRAIRK
ncbi:MAG: plasmid pRiA4b ORF-3 family protein [Deltaproteobacteria bacterium]|nr:plasmid pRiA4b ORF-3 family protein [Deltaproteobacteria bacterium]